MARVYTGALTSLLALAFSGATAAAQGVPQRPSAGQPAVSQPVVQAVPGKEGMALNEALARLARDPRDIDALIDAGNAALLMGDVDAATGFFRRADQVSPGNPRVKAGLAGAMVHNGDPFGAIPLFDEAEKAGALDGTLAADRGLAYDLVGDNATAQRFYRQSLARMPTAEATRRLALSYAIAGDKQNAEQILAPLLSQRNLAAWRARVFALAILGQTEEAVRVANTILPADLAAGVAPYLRYMPRLTRAQQAAAANFGAFPRASEIGRDDPRVAQYAPKRASVAAADAALVPQGEPLGRNARGRDRDRRRSQVATPPPAPRPSSMARPAVTASQPRVVRVAPPEVQPARQAGTQAAAAPTVPLRQAVPAAAPAQVASAPAPAPAPLPSRSEPVVAPAAQAAATGLIPAPGFSLAPSMAAPAVASPPPAASPPQPVAATPTPAPIAAPPPAPLPRSLADAFAEFDRPSTDATPAAGAVDLRRLKAVRPESRKPPQAKKPPEPPKPTHPSRIWVQVATGRDKGALAFDWRRMTREKAEAFRGKAAFISAWGQTNRLLTGPFQSESAANAFIGQLRRADVDGAFVWTSPAGQVVDALAVTARR